MNASCETLTDEETAGAKQQEFKPAYLPSPEEIAAECAKIRAGWSPAERQRRLRVDWRSGPIEITEVAIDCQLDAPDD